MLIGALLLRNDGQNIGLMATAKANKKDLLFLKGLLEVGKVVPVIDRCYPLDHVPEAIRYLETGRARGKVVISVEDSTPRNIALPSSQA
jgi:NADPH:quinone reductase-like Zn-dependent oxidoreductase